MVAESAILKGLMPPSEHNSRLCAITYDVMFSSSLFSGRGSCRDSTVATVVADMVHGRVVDNGCVVNIVNVGDIYVIDGTVVIKLAVVPTSAFVAATVVTIAVSNASIETNPRSPVALMENKPVNIPAPVRRSP